MPGDYILTKYFSGLLGRPIRHGIPRGRTTAGVQAGRARGESHGEAIRIEATVEQAGFQTGSEWVRE
jgi:hypothetical protein